MSVETTEQVTENLNILVMKNACGFNLHCRRWTPTGNPIGLVLIAHGFGEHLEYYDEIATEMTKKSLLVFGHDHSGFGKSEGPRAFIDNFNKYSDDCLQHLQLVQQEFPAVPTFILGHSMGGTIALKLLMKNPTLFEGMVLVAPAVVLNPALATRTKIFAVKVLSRLIPHYVVGSLEYEKITRNQEIIAHMRTDLYRWHSGMKAKFAVEFMGAMSEIYNNLSNIESPFLLLHGGSDQLVELSGSQSLYDTAQSRDKTFKVFEEAYHNLFLELEDVKLEARKLIIDWIESHALNRPVLRAAEEIVTNQDDSRDQEMAGKDSEEVTEEPEQNFEVTEESKPEDVRTDVDVEEPKPAVVSVTLERNTEEPKLENVEITKIVEGGETVTRDLELAVAEDEHREKDLTESSETPKENFQVPVLESGDKVNLQEEIKLEGTETEKNETREVESEHGEQDFLNEIQEEIRHRTQIEEAEKSADSKSEDSGNENGGSETEIGDRDDRKEPEGERGSQKRENEGDNA